MSNRRLKVSILVHTFLISLAENIGQHWGFSTRGPPRNIFSSAGLSDLGSTKEEILGHPCSRVVGFELSSMKVELGDRSHYTLRDP